MSFESKLPESTPSTFENLETIAIEAVAIGEELAAFQKSLVVLHTKLETAHAAGQIGTVEYEHIKALILSAQDPGAELVSLADLVADRVTDGGHVLAAMTHALTEISTPMLELTKTVIEKPGSALVDMSGQIASITIEVLERAVVAIARGGSAATVELLKGILEGYRVAKKQK